MRISVQPLYPTGNYLNVRIGIEQDFPEDTNVETAVNSIWDSITAIHMKRYPHLYNEDGTAKYEMYKGEDEMKGTKVRDIQVGPVSDAVQATMDGINNSQTPDELRGYWLLSKGNLTLSNAYKEKEKQLTNAK